MVARGVVRVVFLVGIACLALSSRAQTAPTVQRGMALVKEPRLYYEMAGQGEAVVLIHGGNLDSRMWDDQFAAFSARYRVVRYDVRGFGRSTPGDTPYSDHDDLRDLLDDLKIDRAHLVGLSLGGRIALDFALAYPKRVRSLVLAGPGLSGFRFSPESNQRFYAEVRAAQKGDWDGALALWTADPYFAPAWSREDLRPRLEVMARSNLKVLLMNWMLQVDLEPPAAERLGELKMPVLLIVGERDVPDIFAIVKLLEEKVPGLKRHTVAGAGHLVSMEKPGEFNTLVMDFLKAPTAAR